MYHLHVLQALEDGQGETVARHAAGDRIPWRPLGEEPRAERLAQGALPVTLALLQRYAPYVALQQALCCGAAMRRMHKLMG